MLWLLLAFCWMFSFADRAVGMSLCILGLEICFTVVALNLCFGARLEIS